ncbi:hypothetical protein LEP1GSC016_1580 [Leptospira borgpetersenii serovar Hardjo-bovis str. Sponselee]|uniref:Uncharacterized protein n=1 Tax=Leptospira borgpetersenii serovar Hardjo-bovis str. Sponselee TaxID=1303729 RepID=M6C9S2_LEPBO|nr:hypothetical protein LEP1GSC016_1580 [Leptospira borgpetersenii serovar Hardjo-bovis str. Sponselee]
MITVWNSKSGKILFVSIDVYYNIQMHNSFLGFVSPVAFEENAA